MQICDVLTIYEIGNEERPQDARLSTLSARNASALPSICWCLPVNKSRTTL